MVRVPTLSPLTGKPVASSYLHASDLFFRDTKGRAVLLRGVNFSGSDKAPLSQPSQKLEGFWEQAENGGESFVGQPLNLNDGSADVHLTRLRSWGFNCFRWVFTWEALEHEGPGKYDYEYMDYTVAVLRKIKQYGFKVFMDPHQDLFSRFTGGSGAPYWTIIACGLNPRRFTATQAAFLQCEWPNAKDPQPIEFPNMLWVTNYTRLAAATISALFFAGKHFAPLCIIDGKNIQDWLQDHFVAACEQLAKHIIKAGDLADDCVIGWDSMNEPNKTYIGFSDLSAIPKDWQFRKGPMPTPIQSFRLGVGMVQQVEHWSFGALGPKRSGSVTINPEGASAWLTKDEDAQVGGSRWGWTRDPAWPLGRCLWAAHGVWDQVSGELLNPSYFSRFGGPKGNRPANFVEDYWLPHWRKYASMLRRVHPEAIMFIQPPVFEPPPKSFGAEDLKQRACVSCHFYDGLTLITKHWNWFNADAIGILRGKYSSILFAVRVGNKAIRQCMREQLGYLREDTIRVLGNYPTLIGEIGIPYDLDNKRTYFGDSKGKGIGDYWAQTLAMDASLNACDGNNLLSFALWTYCPNNTHMWGDGWNGEDLSLWSHDDVKADSQAADELSAPFFLPLQPSDDSNTTSISSSATSSILLKPHDKKGDATEVMLDDLTALSNGSRAAAAFCRPYPVATVGTPLEINFDIRSSEFVFSLQVTEEDLQDSSTATEIYLPFVHYGSDDTLDRSRQGKNDLLAVDVDISAGRYEVHGQYLHWYLSPEDSSASPGAVDSKIRQTIKVKRQGGPFFKAETEPSWSITDLCAVL